MNHYKYDFELFNTYDYIVPILGEKLWFLLKEFWKFSCFYGEYRSNIHFKKK